MCPWETAARAHARPAAGDQLNKRRGSRSQNPCKKKKIQKVTSATGSRQQKPPFLTSHPLRWAKNIPHSCAHGGCWGSTSNMQGNFIQCRKVWLGSRDTHLLLITWTLSAAVKGFMQAFAGWKFVNITASTLLYSNCMVQSVLAEGAGTSEHIQLSSSRVVKYP